MKRWMMQLLRTVVTLVLMVLMAITIFSLRNELKEKRAELAQTKETLKVAESQVALQQLQIEALTKRLQEPPAPTEAAAPAAPEVN